MPPHLHTRPRAVSGKTYPLREIPEAITAYNRGNSLAETSRRISSRHGHPVNLATISRWLAAHPALATYRRLRERGLALFPPPRLIRNVKLYHHQLYEYGYHPAKLAFLCDSTLDDRRSGDTRFAALADFLEQVPDRWQRRRTPGTALPPDRRRRRPSPARRWRTPRPRRSWGPGVRDDGQLAGLVGHGFSVT